ncbi:MAG: LuxR C-terminal-related transcriptional regulator [Bacteroidota bacterium]
MKRVIIQFGFLAVSLMLLVELSKYSMSTRSLTNELLAITLAVVFIGFGLLIGKLLNRQQTDEKTNLNFNKVKELDFSARETEVFAEMVKGKSNKEIGESLFISESTVKTHVSSILFKLSAKRKTEAIKNAQAIGLI